MVSLDKESRRLAEQGSRFHLARLHRTHYVKQAFQHLHERVNFTRYVNAAPAPSNWKKPTENKLEQPRWLPGDGKLVAVLSLIPTHPLTEIC